MRLKPVPFFNNIPKLQWNSTPSWSLVDFETKTTKNTWFLNPTQTNYPKHTIFSISIQVFLPNSLAIQCPIKSQLNNPNPPKNMAPFRSKARSKPNKNTRIFFAQQPSRKMCTTTSAFPHTPSPFYSAWRQQSNKNKTTQREDMDGDRQRRRQWVGFSIECAPPRSVCTAPQNMVEKWGS